MNLLLFCFHTTQVLICDVEIRFLEARRARRLKQIAKLRSLL